MYFLRVGDNTIITVAGSATAVTRHMFSITSDDVKIKEITLNGNKSDMEN